MKGFQNLVFSVILLFAITGQGVEPGEVVVIPLKGEVSRPVFLCPPRIEGRC